MKIKFKNGTRITLTLLALLVSFTLAPTAEAQRRGRGDKTDIWGAKVFIEALGGIQWGGQVNYEGGTAKIGAGPTVGGLLAWKFHRNAAVIASYHYQFTTVDADWHTTAGLREADTVDIGVGYLQFGGETYFPVHPRVVPFIGLTLGASHFTRRDDIDKSEWFFAAAFSGGLKIPIVRNLGFRVQIKLLTTVVANDSTSICISGIGCRVHLDTDALVQGEALGGLYVAF